MDHKLPTIKIKGMEERKKQESNKGRILEFFDSHNIVYKEVADDHFLICWDKRIEIVLPGIVPEGDNSFKKVLRYEGVKTHFLANVYAAQKFTGLEPLFNQGQKMLNILKSMQEVRTDIAKVMGVKNPAHEVAKLRRKGHEISSVDKSAEGVRSYFYKQKTD